MHVYDGCSGSGIEGNTALEESIAYLLCHGHIFIEFPLPKYCINILA